MNIRKNCAIIFNMSKHIKICSFFGHRKLEVTDELVIKLKKVILSLITRNKVNTFYFGGYSDFDELCHTLVDEFKKEFPYLKEIYVRPYYENLQQNIVDLYKREFDDCIYLKPKNNFGKFLIVYRNYAMVDKSEYIIFYVKKDKSGGALNTFKYAKNKNKNIINIAE